MPLNKYSIYEQTLNRISTFFYQMKNSFTVQLKADKITKILTTSSLKQNTKEQNFLQLLNILLSLFDLSLSSQRSLDIALAKKVMDFLACWIMLSLMSLRSFSTFPMNPTMNSIKSFFLYFSR